MVSENSGSVFSPETQSVEELSVRHLQAELARIDLKLQRAVRRWQAAGQDPADAFRGLYVSDSEAVHLLQRPFGSNWGQTSPLPEAEEQAFLKAERQAVLQALAIQPGQPTRLQSLIEAFDLDEFEKDVLLICLAPAFDLRYEKIYGYLQDDVTRRRPGINLVLDLLCPSGMERVQALSHFASDAPLLKYHLLERFSEPGQNKAPLLSQSLSVDETLVHWLLGSYQPAGEIAPYLSLTPAPSDPTHSENSAEVETTYSSDLLKQNPLFIFSGPDRLAQEAAAHHLAALAKRSLLSIDLSAINTEETSLLRSIRTALRDAHLTGSLLLIKGWDVCLEDPIFAANGLAAFAQHPGMVILAAQAAWRPASLPEARPIHWQEFPIPDSHERKDLWTDYLQNAQTTTELDLTDLAGQFALTREQIRAAVLLAVNHTRQQGRTLSEDELMAAARASSSSRLSSLAHKIPARYRWDDIVLPADQISLLQEIVATVRGRATVLEEWEVGKKLASSRGVSILFAGPPGTGKTMSAQIIAAELGLDLYKIDLSTIVSKYIGETEKNLERIFSEAESSNAILFFDEADALFGKRSEVRDSHDRYANVEISYLLQRMEAYDGVTILATNLRANLDEAFTRRLQFAVDFPFPEEEDRLRIWQSLFPPLVPRAELDLPLLARRYKLAGGNIRNIIVSAAYLASANGGVVTMEHLLHGTRRELQKMGRLVNANEMAPDSEYGR
ncbi:MAG TPA: ATP-binding protein [Anaerolineales bacterium]|nr:ATP-binding protein [Anaerolineales bacterium]